MQLALERRILELKPELTAAQVSETALDIADYWINGCLEDVLEASD